MTTSTAVPGHSDEYKVRMKRELTTFDYTNIRNLMGMQPSEPIPKDIIDSCLKQQAIYHRRANGPLPNEHIGIALKRCGFEKVGQMIRRIEQQEEVTEINDMNESDDLDHVSQDEVDSGANTFDSSAGTGHPASSVKSEPEAAVVNRDLDTDPCAVWANVEKGTKVVVMTDIGAKPGIYVGNGQGDNIRIKVGGSEKKYENFHPSKVEVQGEIPMD